MATFRLMRDGWIKNVYMKLMGLNLFKWFGLHGGGKIDVWLLTKTNGRLAMLVGWPIGLLESTGARTGLVRKNALMYLRDGDRLLLAGSRGGDPRHPAWLHNVRAHPEVRFRWAGRNEVRKARVADPVERAELWPKLLELYPGYEVYEGLTGGRQIPVVILEKAAG